MPDDVDLGLVDTSPWKQSSLLRRRFAHLAWRAHSAYTRLCVGSSVKQVGAARMTLRAQKCPVAHLRHRELLGVFGVPGVIMSAERVSKRRRHNASHTRRGDSIARSPLDDRSEARRCPSVPIETSTYCAKAGDRRRNVKVRSDRLGRDLSHLADVRRAREGSCCPFQIKIEGLFRK